MGLFQSCYPKMSDTDYDIPFPLPAQAADSLGAGFADSPLGLGEPLCLARLRMALATAIAQPAAERAQAWQAALSACAASADLDALLARCAAPVECGYRRHLLAADPEGRYSAVAIVWGAGQFSPVHGHQTWCAYGVLHGALSETRYDWCAATSGARPGTCCARLPGDISYTDAGHGGIHRLGNPHPGIAVSLHIYGVPGSRIATDVNRLVAPLA